MVEFACGIPHLLKGEFSEQVGRGIDSWSMRQPLGVCAGITPFNFPAMVPMWMFPVALACGNTFILKPSRARSVGERDASPSCSSRPDCPTASSTSCTATSARSMRSSRIRSIAAVSFVGSTPIANYIYATAAANGKRVQALGGAKNHMLVMPDADLDQAADALVGAAYGSAGERCMAISVAVAVGAAGDALIEKLKPRVQRAEDRARHRSGRRDGTAGDARRISSACAATSSMASRKARRSPSTAARSRSKASKTDSILGGCLFDHVTPAMKIYREEIFGPVLSVVRVPDLDAGIRLISENEYGNGASIFTRDGGAAREFTSRVQIGMVGVNVPIPVPMAFHSFGGWKRSMFGDMAMHGLEGVRFYTRLKTITSRWPQHRIGADFAIPTMTRRAEEPSMANNRLILVVLEVESLAASIRFYRGLLGLRWSLTSITVAAIAGFPVRTPRPLGTTARFFISRVSERGRRRARCAKRLCGRRSRCDPSTSRRARSPRRSLAMSPGQDCEISDR